MFSLPVLKRSFCTTSACESLNPELLFGQGSGQGQGMGQDRAGAWSSGGPLTGMGQRSVSASNLNAMNFPSSRDWLGSQDEREHHSSLFYKLLHGTLPHCCVEHTQEDVGPPWKT